MQKSIWSKSLSLILMAAMILGMLLITNFSPANAGYGSNGKFLAPIEPPDPDATKIYTAQQLSDMRNDLNGSYVLMNDIDLTGLNGGQWAPIGADFSKRFSGTFDGQGYVIRNLDLRSDRTYQFIGLFGYIGDAEIKNVGLECTDINYYYTSSLPLYVGGICGTTSPYDIPYIYNCYNSGSIYVYSSNGDTFAGGICGYTSSTFTDGVADISNCYNTGEVSSISKSDASYAGGISGYSVGSVSNCYNTGYISSDSPLSGPSDAGGICGNSTAITANIFNCYNTGTVSSSCSGFSGSSNAGGICGSSTTSPASVANLSNCYNTGSIFSFTNDFSDSSNAGGICGSDGSGTTSIINCYSIGDISSSALNAASSYAGGICGRNDSVSTNIFNCVVLSKRVYAEAPDPDDIYSYLIGYSGEYYETKRNNLSLEDITGNPIDDADIHITLKQAKSQNTYTNQNWDFDEVWQMVSGYKYPQLRGLPPAGPEDIPVTFDQAVEILKEKPAIDISAYEPADIIAYLEEQISILTEFFNPEVKQFDVSRYYFMDPDGGDNYLLNISIPIGFSISGNVKSYNPNKPTIIRLMKDGEIVCKTSIVGENGYGQEVQNFSLKGITPGTYDLVISKAAHAKFTIQNLIVEDEDLDLTISGRPESQLITLRCGDINGDGLINDADLTILWRAGNYNKKASEADEPLCDLNGDGLINDADLTILWLAYNYNRGGIIIPWNPPVPYQRAIAMLDKNGPIPIPSAMQEDIDKTIVFLRSFIVSLVSIATGLDPIEVRYWAESDGGDDGFYLIDPDKAAGNDYRLKTMQAAKPVSKIINCLADKEYSISFGIKGLDAVEGRQFKLSYDAEKLELIDLAAQTKALDTETGPIKETNIIIVSHEVDEKLGVIIFMVDKTLNSEVLWQGAVNIFKFKAKASGEAVLTSEIMQ